MINHNISIISHTSSLGRNSKIPSIKWFPDFQEFKFPNNFSLKQRIARKLDIYFSSINSTKILLSSYSVQKQLKLINKKAFKKSSVLRHATFLRNFKIIGQSKLKKKFNIKRNYFFLPNHFWKHKNHIVVYKAIKLAKKNDKKILLVTTGNTYDYRFPDHYNFLQNFIKKEHLFENILHLGIIDQNDLFSLIKHSLAVINPSLFEGWGNTLEHSILFDKIAVLSNIDVHKERKNKNKILFNSNDHNKLSQIMLKILKKNISFKKERGIVNENLEFNNFGKNYLNFIKKITNQS